MYPLKEPMHIHSLGGELAEATILERMGDNRYLAEYNGVKCSAIFTLRAQGATRLKRPTLAHFCVAVPRISAASPSLRRLELNQIRPFQVEAFSQPAPLKSAVRQRHYSRALCQRQQQRFAGRAGRRKPRVPLGGKGNPFVNRFYVDDVYGVIKERPPKATDTRDR